MCNEHNSPFFREGKRFCVKEKCQKTHQVNIGCAWLITPDYYTQTISDYSVPDRKQNFLPDTANPHRSQLGIVCIDGYYVGHGWTDGR